MREVTTKRLQLTERISSLEKEIEDFIARDAHRTSYGAMVYLVDLQSELDHSKNSLKELEDE